MIFTTTQILEAAANKELNLDDPLTALLPDFRQYDQNCWEREVTFRQCLGHQTPFPAVEPLYTYGQDQQTLRAFILQRRWPAGPHVYSDINFHSAGAGHGALAGPDACFPGSGLGFHLSPVTATKCGDRAVHVAVKGDAG